jgi:hypothetical protein
MYNCTYRPISALCRDVQAGHPQVKLSLLRGILYTTYSTGAFLYVRYSFLLIFNMFCDLGLMHSVGEQCGKKIHRTVLPHSPPKTEL